MIDNVNSPPHYTSSDAKCICGNPIECIQVTRHMNFNLGNAMKYIWRAEHKGKTIEDLAKAIWYLNNEIGRLMPEVQKECPIIGCNIYEPHTHASPGYAFGEDAEYTEEAKEVFEQNQRILGQASSGNCFSIT